MQRYNLKISKRQEMQAGITLVALVITVVIMLILAGVAIEAVVDGDGLFSKTREATEIYENATENEEDKIQSMLNEIDRYIENPSNPILKEAAELGVIVNENQTFDGRLKGTYSNPIIPKGFAPINENGADWGTETGYQKGLVITDEVDGEGNSIGNEFVWISVDGTIVKFERQDFGKQASETEYSNYSDPTISENQELANITTSVKTNGGFYIARFEAGKPQDGILATDGSIEPVSKQGATVWNNIAWSDNGTNDDINPGNGAVTVARSMYINTPDSKYGVVSTLIYGTQWDTALNFIGAYDTGEANYNTYATDSTGMGNYSGIGEGDLTDAEPATSGTSETFRQKKYI